MAPKVYIILDDTDSDDDAMPEVEVAQADSSSTEHDSSTDAMVGFEGDSSSTGNSSSANEPMDASSADESTDNGESSDDEDECGCETCIYEREHHMVIRGSFNVLVMFFCSLLIRGDLHL